MDSIRIDTGEKRLAIEDMQGNVKGELVFNPKDVVFAEKFYRLLGEFEIKQAEYKERAAKLDAENKLDADGKPVNAEEGLAFLRETCEFVRAQIDALFGDGISQIAFGDTLNLEVFFQFFDAVTPYIKAERSKKIEQYINQARKGKPK